MSNDDKAYNGWTNYETWCVHLWLSNDEGTYSYWREAAERHRKEAPGHPNVSGGVWTAQEAARYTLGKAMAESFETFHPFRGEHLATAAEPDVYCDLLDAALSEVRWSEIAEAFLEGDKPEGEEARGGPLFDLGQMVSTPGALEPLTAEDIAEALSRHQRGDWGLADAEDRQENETALREG